MMRITKLTSPASTLGVICLMLGCGSSPPPTSNPAKSAEPTPAKAEAPAEKPEKAPSEADDMTGKREKLAADALAI